MLNLANFDDQLDPGVLDEGLKLYKKEAVSQLRESDKNEWLAHVEKQEIYVLLGRAKKITELFCDCQSDEDISPENTCKHGAATLFALREKTGTKAKKVANKGKKKAKDASFELLESLEPAQIFDFVKALLAKDKGFKSQFMLHFSEREEVDEAQYKAIILDAIKAVKGRKKYMSAGDASKIAKALAPLLDQATTAESKGQFKESYIINKLFISEVLPLEDFIKTNSVYFNRTVDRVKEFHKQIAGNKKAPLEFREAFFKELEEKVMELWGSHHALRSLYFDTYIAAAKTQNKLDVVEQMLLADLEKVKKKEANRERGSYFSIMSRQPQKILFLANFIQNECGDANRAFDLLEKNCHFDAILMKILPMYVEQGKAEKAYQLLQKNTQLGEHYSLEKKAVFLKKKFEVYMAAGKEEEAAELAHKRLILTNFAELDFMAMVKKASTPEAWEERRDEYLFRTKSGQSYPKQVAYIYLLGEMENWDAMYQKLLKKKQLMSIFDIGSLLLEQQPKRFVELFKELATSGITTPGYSVGTNDAHATLKYLHRILDLPNGIETAKKLLDLIESKREYYAKQAQVFRKKYGL